MDIVEYIPPEACWKCAGIKVAFRSGINAAKVLIQQFAKPDFTRSAISIEQPMVQG
jgi:hypothetical protein